VGAIGGANHYYWEELQADSPIERIARRRISAERMSLFQVLLERGCHVPTHSHENEQIACVLSGRIRFGLGAEDSPERVEIELRGGEVLHLPSNTPHSADALEDTVVLDVFSPVIEASGIDPKR